MFCLLAQRISLLDETVEIAAVDLVQVPFGKAAKISPIDLIQVPLLSAEAKSRQRIQSLGRAESCALERIQSSISSKKVLWSIPV